MHAYLIIAHEQFDLLESLLKCIDDARNDIYIHIDSRSELDIGRIEKVAEFPRRVRPAHTYKMGRLRYGQMRIYAFGGGVRERA